MTESPPAPPFADLVERIAASQDKQAFSTLFEHFAPRIKSWLMGGGCPEGSADELAQETLLAVWHKATSYQRKRAAVSTWVFTIARNKRIDRLRKERRPTVHLDDPSVVVTEQPTGYAWDEIIVEQGRLEESIGELPAEQQEVLHQFYVQDKSHSAIANLEACRAGGRIPDSAESPWPTGPPRLDFKTADFRVG